MGRDKLFAVTKAALVECRSCENAQRAETNGLRAPRMIGNERWCVQSQEIVMKLRLCDCNV